MTRLAALGNSDQHTSELHMSRSMTKPTKWYVYPAKTQITLGIRPVWSESSLSAWRKLGSLSTHVFPDWSESSLGAQVSLLAHRAQWWAYRIGSPLSSICVCVCMCVVCQHFQTSPLKPLGRLKPNFIWSLLGTGEQKFVQTVQVTWPRWPPWPYMVKTSKNLLLQNQMASDLETWYAVLGARVLPFVQMMTLGWPWPIYSKVKFGPLCFCMGKKVKQWVFQKLL